MRIENTAGCAVASCAADLGPDCPAPLKGHFDSKGFPLGCKSACAANLDGNPGNSPNCCSGQFNTPATFTPNRVAHFKRKCPNSYVYAYDESSGSAFFTCPANKKPDYTITLCPQN